MKYPDTDRFAEQAIARWRSGEAPLDSTVAIPRPWRSPPDESQLNVRYQCEETAAGPSLDVRINEARFGLDDPVILEPVAVAKPWGREIWFTGIEARGESRVRGDGGTIGLGSYLSLAPQRICRREPVVLLKILDPRPEPVLGELYLEVHEEKREAYVVTRVDPRAWPDGSGQIRYGVDQMKRSGFDNDDDFRQAFLATIQNYEALQRAIESGDSGLEEQAIAAREAASAFIAVRPVEVGDVIGVPTWIPHSLQQGVQVVEFQTPTYERFIISSTQKVITQESWDSPHAIEHMSLEEPAPPPPQPIAPGIDRIVQFEEFGVWRGHLEPNAPLELPRELPYALIICIEGECQLSGPTRSLALNPTEAALIPQASISNAITTRSRALTLIAAPGL